MNYDKILLKILIKNDKINFHKTKLIKLKYPNILSFLNLRFNDSQSLNETINRIKYNIEIRPTCKICGNPVKYVSKDIFKTYCCVSCSTIGNKDKIRQTCLKKYGVDWSSKSSIVKEKSKQTCLKKYGTKFVLSNKEVKEKSKQTCLKKYGVTNAAKSNIIKEKTKQTCLEKYRVEFVWQSDKIKEKIRETCFKKYGVSNPQQFNVVRKKTKQTCLEKYGVLYPTQLSEIYNKIRKTCLEKYGVNHPSKSKLIKDKVKNTFLQHYGVDSYFKTNEYKKYYEENKLNIINKSNNTKRKKHTFNSSIPEEKLFEYIKLYFPFVKRQYSDNRYPFCCDFYIPELDVFLELNGFWTHGKHPFDKTNINDQNILKEWIEKSKNSLFYLGAINTWTIRDVDKRNTAKQNNLKFKEVWSLNEGKKFIEELYYAYPKSKNRTY